MSGGKQFWLVNGLDVSRDNLFNTEGKTYGFPRELNLDDYFFNFGIRLRKELIKDLYSAPIVLANGDEKNSQYIPYPWPYFPLSKPEYTNVIGKDLGPVITQFVSPIDTLPNLLKKIILLQSSEFTKTVPVPALINLDQVVEKIKPSQFDESAKILGVLVQGENTSLFSNRIKPTVLANTKEVGNINVILFGDGNIAENQTEKGQPLSLGYDKWTNNFYSNKNLIMNGVHYLASNEELLLLLDKTWEVAFLDQEKIIQNASIIKIWMLLLPILLGISIGVLNQLIRIKQLKI